MTFKLDVLYAITDCLKAITPANGFAHDLSDFTDDELQPMQRVFRGRLWFGESDPIPMVCLYEGAHPADEVSESPVDTTTGEYDWDLIVQGFVNDDPVHPTDPAYRLMADVRRKLAAERKRKHPMKLHQRDPFGLGAGSSHITDIRIGPGVVRPADDISAKAYFWLSLRIRIIDNASTL